MLEQKLKVCVELLSIKYFNIIPTMQVEIVIPWNMMSNKIAVDQACMGSAEVLRFLYLRITFFSTRNTANLPSFAHDPDVSTSGVDGAVSSRLEL